MRPCGEELSLHTVLMSRPEKVRNLRANAVIADKLLHQRILRNLTKAWNDPFVERPNLRSMTSSVAFKVHTQCCTHLQNLGHEPHVI